MEFIDNWCRTVKDVLFQPREFFRKMLKEGEIFGPLKFALFNMLIAPVLGYVYLFVVNHEMFILYSQAYGSNLFLYAVAAIVSILISGSVSITISSGICHILLRLVGAKHRYDATFRIIAYLSVFTLISWIPYAGFFVTIYMLYVLVVAFSEVHEISMFRAAVPLVVILIIAAISAAAIAFFWIGGFTQEHTERSVEFERKISCAYSNIELDSDYAKWDSSNKVFYGFVSNTGVDDVTITKVEVWIDGEKQLPIELNTNNHNLTTIDKNGHLEYYVDLSSAFSGGESSLTKIKFVTECEPVFDSIVRPREGWEVFDWATSGGILANE